MESPRLLVIDESAEQAEVINSLLRNSGINIRIKHARSIQDAEDFYSNFKPFLIVFNVTESVGHSTVDVLEFAEEQGVPVVLRTRPDDLAALAEAMNHHGFLVVNRDENDQLIKTVTFLLDQLGGSRVYDELKAKMDELQSRYNLLLESSNECIAYIHEGLHVYANRAYLELVNASDFREIEAASLLEYMRGANCDLKMHLRGMNEGAMPEGAVKVEIRTLSGDTVNAELVFSPARFEGEDCIQMLVRKSDASAALKEELNRLRLTDPVTRLANRNGFFEYLEQKLGKERVDTHHAAVYYLQADGANELREKLGLRGWDTFMQAVAKFIRTSIEEHDLAARFDDLGIVVYAQRPDKGALKDFGECLVEGFRSLELPPGGPSAPVTCSVGMTALGVMSRKADEILDHAMSEFSLATQAGDCLRRYRPETPATEIGQQDEKWIERIRVALENNDLYTVQHFIVNLEDEAEGLFENRTYLRDDSGDLAAEQFIHAAERGNLGAMIDRNVIQGLLANISGSGDRHLVNIGQNSLHDFSFPSWLNHQLEEQGVEGSQLVLQLEASTARADIKSVGRLMDELSPSGCRFSISGMDECEANISLLKKAGFSYAKLRAGLAESVAGNPENQAIIKEVVKAAQETGAVVIAEDIRNSADLASLWQCGVKLVSGNFLKEAHQVAN